MANFALGIFVLLSFVSAGLTLTVNDLLGLGYLRQAQPEEPRVVEVVKWRQTVCLTAAPGVLPCMISLENYQHSQQGYEQYHQGSGYYSKHLPLEEKETVDDNLRKTLTKEDSAHDSISLESDEEYLHLKKRSTPTRKLYSPKVVKTVKLEKMGSSYLGDAVRGPRRGKYLRLGPGMARRQTVYVTKVVDSPVIATLVASTCLPDIGIPNCDEIQQTQYPPSQAGQPIYSNVTPDPNSNSNNYNGQQQTTSTAFPNIIQNIADFLNRPNVVQSNQPPEVKPVVVYQQAPPPGIFDGINAFLMPNGSLFGIFNRPADNGSPSGGGLPGIPGFGQFPQLPQFPPAPQVPTLQEFFYRPENDISPPSNIMSVLNPGNGQYNRPGAGPPTQSPGILGGLFASPTRPEGAVYQNPTTTTTSTTPQPSIFDGINNIFRPTSRPLIIEGPDRRPVVIERPIYVAELPVIPGIFDIFQTPNRPVQVDSNAEPQVIRDPVYVLQKPNEAPQIFGVQLPNFNIFGGSSTSPSTLTNPNPPRAIPDVVPADPEGIVKADSSVDSQSPENSKSAAYVPPTTTTPSPSYAEEYVEKSSLNLEADSDQEDSLDDGWTRIVDPEGEVKTGITDEKHDAESISDASELSGNLDEIEYKKIEIAGIKEQVDNEA